MQDNRGGVSRTNKPQQSMDFLYHLAGSSHQNINTIFIDAAAAPAAAAALRGGAEGAEYRGEEGAKSFP